MREYVPGTIVSSELILDTNIVKIEPSQTMLIEGNNFVVDGQGTSLVSSFKPQNIPQCKKPVFSAGGGVVLGKHYLTSKYISKSLLTKDQLCTISFDYYGDITLLEVAAKDRDKHEVVSTSFQKEIVTGEFQRYSGTLDLSAFTSDFALYIRINMQHEGFYLIDQVKGSIHETIIWEVDPAKSMSTCYNVGFSLFDSSQYQQFQGVAIHMRNCDGVTLRNFSAQGFVTALFMENCTNCTIEKNNFSDNYHDTEYGWGDGKEGYGGIIMVDCSNNIIRDNRAQRVWNGLVLTRSHKNHIVNNSMSYCSNVCLKMSYAKHNIIEHNDFSWGLRIYPGEVHARDSVSCLMENGSDNNKIMDNDFSYGGDGIFIRVLNNWCTRGNYFLRNDCSYANNNAIEAWSPQNTYEENEASFSSYGFWLGGSDETIMIRNKIQSNGTKFMNAPEPFGNAGVAVVNGSCEGMVMRDNFLKNNRGPALAFGANCSQRVRHWLIRDNQFESALCDSRGYNGDGIHLFEADHIRAVSNSFGCIEGSTLSIGNQVSHLNFKQSERVGEDQDAPLIEATSDWICGSSVCLTLNNICEDGSWYLDEQVQKGKQAEFLLEKPGYHRVFFASDHHLLWHSFYVLPKGELVKGKGQCDIDCDGVQGIADFSVFEKKSETVSLDIKWDNPMDLRSKAFGLFLLFNHEAEIRPEGRVGTFVFHSLEGTRQYKIPLPVGLGPERYILSFYSFFGQETETLISEDSGFDQSSVTSVTITCDAGEKGMGELIVDYPTVY